MENETSGLKPSSAKRYPTLMGVTQHETIFRGVSLRRCLRQAVDLADMGSQT
ncbi:hypothetical protein BgiMline_009723, partial [Biomphalaria glabrata]